MAQTPAKTKDHPDVQAMQRQREEINKSNEEAMQRMESTQPTPTQEESDLFRLGVAVDEKEPDGSGPTIIRTLTVANVPLGAEPPDITDPYSAEGKAAQERSTRERNEQRERTERERAERERAAKAKRDEARG